MRNAECNDDGISHACRVVRTPGLPLKTYTKKVRIGAATLRVGSEHSRDSHMSVPDCGMRNAECGMRNVLNAELSSLVELVRVCVCVCIDDRCGQCTCPRPRCLNYYVVTAQVNLVQFR